MPRLTKTTNARNETMSDDRRALHAYLSREAHDAWHDFAAEQGVSVSGLLEASGRNLAPVVDGSAEPVQEQLDLVDAARKIDAARRRRRRNG
jgi:hypothetical protein